MQPPNPGPPYQQPPYQQPAFQPYVPPAAPPSPPTPPPLPRDVSVMDALRFTTSGSSGWLNVLFCALLYLSTQVVPILGIIVMDGFFAEVHRRLVLRHPDPYLRFDFADFSGYLTRGVAPFLMMVFTALPFVFAGVGMSFLALLAAGVGAAALTRGDEGLALLLAFGVTGLCFVPISVLWLALSNAAVTRAELTGDLSKSLNLGAIWSYAGRVWKRVLITAILMSFVWAGLLMVGMLACVVGMFFTISIALIANLHLRWQIYNEYLLEGGEPIELAAWETLPSEMPKQPTYVAPPPQYSSGAPFDPGAPKPPV